jgi:hypothetical protein
MKKQFNTEKLDEIFDIDTTDISDISILDEDIIDDSELIEKDESDEEFAQDNSYIDEELKGLIQTCKQIMDGAKYLIGAAPDAESIAAAANLIGSLGTIMSEFNKAVLLKKKFNETTKLEKMKIKARKEIIRLRAQLDTKKLSLGDGNTINIQNNNLVPFSQEDIVKNIIAEEKQL